MDPHVSANLDHNGVALTSDGWKYFVEPAYLFMVICIWAATSMFDQHVCYGTKVFW